MRISDWSSTCALPIYWASFSGSAEIGENGKEKLAQFANTLKEIAAKIPDDIKWILRVDGHTDDVPIATSRFPSNWELSTARAIRSEEHTYELQSLMRISYAVFCLKKK